MKSQTADIKVLQSHIQEIRQRLAIKAPSLPSSFHWLNVARPLRENDLKGKIVLLDFWTYCCINCMHILPDLHLLEEKYKNAPFAVIGVHSAKFTNEQDVENIRQAILRYHIKHPVVVDENYTIWQQYGVRAWPTLVLIDPEGYIIGYFSGEGHFDNIDKYIQALLNEYEGHEILNTSPLPLQLESQRTTKNWLHFPGKILADPKRNILYISDSNNNRILVADTSGVITTIIGDGRAGFRDGNFATAQFRNPQGLAIYKGKLLVADTDNHAVRVIDFKNQTVTTIAGTGEKGYFHQVSGKAREIPLNSPWDLTVVNDKCYIAMAGSHQIGLLDLHNNHYEIYAGTGQEARIDGFRLQAAFAQPSGITTDGDALYIADSEVSSIRKIDLKSGKVTTLAGGDLFDFGNRDGAGHKARFQHPLGITFARDKLYVADTYNHKIRMVDPRSGQTKTVAGKGKPGYRDGKNAQFFEPGGITFLGEKLYIADTNNHQIRILNLTDNTTSTLSLTLAPKLAEKSTLVADFPNRVKIEHPEQLVQPGEFQLKIAIQLPEGQKLNPLSPLQYLLKSDSPAITGEKISQIQTISNPRFNFVIPLNLQSQNNTSILSVELLYYFCSKDEQNGTCKVRAVQHIIPIRPSHSGKNIVTLLEKAPADQE